jgi:hypothetical protein
MSIPCPPAPSYIRDRGISDCEYLQMRPSVQESIKESVIRSSHNFENLLTNNPEGYYKIGGIGDMNTPMRMFGTHHMGRSVLSQSSAQRFNNGPKSVKPSSAGSYGSTGSNSFIGDLWTAQVITYWLTDGAAFKEAQDGKQVGLITSKGFSPSNLAPLIAKMDANGVVAEDLRSLLNPTGNRSTLFLLGPDGMFGPAAESIIEEFVGTDKLFGKTVPAGKARLALGRLASNIMTPKIQAALDKRLAGNPPPPREETELTPCNQLSNTAKAARSDCPTPPNVEPPQPVIEVVEDEVVESASDDNTMLLLGFGAAAVAILGVAVYVKRKKA